MLSRTFAHLSLSAHSVAPWPQSLPVLGPRSCQGLTRLGWALEDADTVGVLAAASAPGASAWTSREGEGSAMVESGLSLQGFSQLLAEQLVESDGCSLLDGPYRPDCHMKQPVLKSSRCLLGVKEGKSDAVVTPTAWSFRRAQGSD